MPLKKTESSHGLSKLINKNEGEKFTTSEMLKHRKYYIGPAKNQKAVEYLLENELATTRSPQQKVNVNDVNKKHNILKRTFYDGRKQLPLNEGQLDQETSVFKTPERFDNLGLQYDNATTPPPNVYAVNPDQEYDETDVYERLASNNTENESPIKPSNNSGGKSKRRKSKTKSCCSVRKSAKVCRRKTDNKKFRLPRRFSRKTCLAKKPRGFTMRSSCSPYKGCKKTRKGGMMGNTELTDEYILKELQKYPAAYKKLIDDMFEGTNELSDEQAANLRENVEQKAINTIKSVTNSLKKMSENELNNFLKWAKENEEKYRINDESGGYKKSSYKTRKGGTKNKIEKPKKRA